MGFLLSGPNIDAIDDGSPLGVGSTNAIGFAAALGAALAAAGVALFTATTLAGALLLASEALLVVRCVATEVVKGLAAIWDAELDALLTDAALAAVVLARFRPRTSLSCR